MLHIQALLSLRFRMLLYTCSLIVHTLLSLRLCHASPPPPPPLTHSLPPPPPPFPPPPRPLSLEQNMPVGRESSRNGRASGGASRMGGDEGPLLPAGMSCYLCSAGRPLCIYISHVYIHYIYIYIYIMYIIFIYIYTHTHTHTYTHTHIHIHIYMYIYI
jgi:hypothetical protein